MIISTRLMNKRIACRITQGILQGSRRQAAARFFTVKYFCLTPTGKVVYTTRVSSERTCHTELTEMNYDAVTKQSLLYDFYGELLTKRQREVMELYNEENLSLGEIAEEFGISRQGVHDALHKAQKALEEYEQKLGLVERFSATRDAINSISGEIDQAIDLAAAKASGDVSERLRQIRSELEQLEI